MIFFAPASLQHALRQFTAHYHTERNHQGLENRLPQPAPVTALPITLFNADSDSAGCSATTIGPQADECRLSFFGQFGVNNGLARRKQTGDPPINDERRTCERENAGAQISQHPEWTALLFDDLGGAQRGDLRFSEASSAFSRANKKCRPRHER